jgi:hypothetical protein
MEPELGQNFGIGFGTKIRSFIFKEPELGQIFGIGFGN